ncbi:hypothetical protein [Clostridium gasigenes]|uniref:Prealbumin-like fold domain-containing protein n=1 Tax=Clostridium gasigenes TaxID=94869 RepID=A0A1H0UR30_9CLOT|nr:hypothetical protein [Clostridium gasigenes]MBB6624421.1 calcium-binding protein [Clostridium gasigenes]MBU3088684.1 calcium-binding protein [Clostridium gasigenes]SDP68624.1 hypothetical protein SAMN04488529_11238 [Clostridium gasigenes]
MKIRIDDEYSNLGEDLNIVFGEYCENDISKQEDGTFGKESSCYNNNDSIYERSNNNEFDMEIQYPEESSYEDSTDEKHIEYEALDKKYEEKCEEKYEEKYEEKCEVCEENYDDSSGKIKVSVKLEDSNGVEIKGAKVNLYELNGVCPKLHESKLTDFKGEIIFDNLVNGCYRIISLVDRKFFEKPVYITWNEVTIDNSIKDANICVVNKIKPSCYRELQKISSQI